MTTTSTGLDYHDTVVGEGAVATSGQRVTGSATSMVRVGLEEIYGRRYEDVPVRIPDIARARELLGVDCDTPLEEGLRRTVNWVRSVAG